MELKGIKKNEGKMKERRWKVRSTLHLLSF
jgi:hypothetical protein